jgi:hypothetical protein
MDTPTLVKWIIWCAIAVLVCAGVLGSLYLWHTWPAPSGPGVASTTAQEQAPASPATLNTSAQELQQSEVQAQRANNPSGNASAGSSAATQAQLQASQNALEQIETQQKVQEQ